VTAEGAKILSELLFTPGCWIAAVEKKFLQVHAPGEGRYRHEQECPEQGQGKDHVTQVPHLRQPPGRRVNSQAHILATVEVFRAQDRLTFRKWN
jgi:hypothetical protein